MPEIIKNAKKPVGVIGALIAALSIGIGTGKVGDDMTDARKQAVADSLLAVYESAVTQTLTDKAVPERARYKLPDGTVVAIMPVSDTATLEVSYAERDTAGEVIKVWAEKDMVVDGLPATVDVPNPSKRLTGFVKGDTVTIKVYSGDSLIYKRQRPITCDPPGENDAWALRVADMLSPDRIAPMDTVEAP